MKFGLDVPNMAGLGDARKLADLAREAEEAGWDGFLVWDSVLSPAWDEGYARIGRDDKRGVADPWISLTAIALATQRMRIGPMITPLSRRRPWKVARETVTLDHLSGGRLVLPVGLGAPDDAAFARVNETRERRQRAERLDEALAILAGLWGGARFEFHGRHFVMDEVQFLPRPLQEPRIPVWVVGAWPYDRSMRRALRWDGVIAQILGRDGGVIAADELAKLAAYVSERREAPFDIVVEGETPAHDLDSARGIVTPFMDAGATWWLEGFVGVLQTVGLRGVRERVRAGPPR